jgi:hypothetical protein
MRPVVKLVVVFVDVVVKTLWVLTPTVTALKATFVSLAGTKARFPTLALRRLKSEGM